MGWVFDGIFWWGLLRLSHHFYHNSNFKLVSREVKSKPRNFCSTACLINASNFTADHGIHNLIVLNYYFKKVEKNIRNTSNFYGFYRKKKKLAWRNTWKSHPVSSSSFCKVCHGRSHRHLRSRLRENQSWAVSPKLRKLKDGCWRQKLKVHVVTAITFQQISAVLLLFRVHLVFWDMSPSLCATTATLRQLQSHAVPFAFQPWK